MALIRTCWEHVAKVSQIQLITQILASIDFKCWLITSETRWSCSWLSDLVLPGGLKMHGIYTLRLQPGMQQLLRSDARLSSMQVALRNLYKKWLIYTAICCTVSSDIMRASKCNVSNICVQHVSTCGDCGVRNSMISDYCIVPSNWLRPNLGCEKRILLYISGMHYLLEISKLIFSESCWLRWVQAFPALLEKKTWPYVAILSQSVAVVCT